MWTKQLFRTFLSDTLSTDKEGVGCIRLEGNNAYRWVYNNTGGTLQLGGSYCHSAGKGLAFVSGNTPAKTSFGISSTLYEEIFVYTSATTIASSINLMAGVAISACPASNYCWIQIAGYNPTVYVNNSGTTTLAVGCSMIMSSTHTYLTNDVLAGTAPTSQHNALLLGTTTASATNLVAATINCLP